MNSNRFYLPICCWGWVAAAMLAGCDAPVGDFETNEVYSLTLAYSREVEVAEVNQDVAQVINQLFGTPDEPKWPDALVDPGLEMNLQNLARAAGPISSDEDGTHRGLFREHCVTCHALTGDGAGPASIFQNPYPRDFRAGVFKWKSTERYEKPTRDDLLTVLHRGVAGSGMPSFALISPEDLDILVDYTIYLSVRGETERELMKAAVDEMGYGEDEIEDDARIVVQGDSDGALLVEDVIADVTESWAEAEDFVVQVPTLGDLKGDALAEAIGRGKELYHGQIANCVGCHGEGGIGQAVTLDYDDWTKEYSTRLGLTPSDRDDMRPFKDVGALTPRVIQPRRLLGGVLRGGGDFETLYRRITQGIAGTPMPAVRVTEEEDGVGLTAEQVADLVRYVQSLVDPDFVSSPAPSSVL